ncbi:MAG: phosphoribosylformylglycinamidine synthase subunit PurQ [Saprospiraceae bacterium]|nr:phosphoribosylformylglycinamidine synthase subunit PurQ [Saprospiraceae bacterium]
MKFGIIVFPGSNCDDDVLHLCSDILGAEVRKIWHKDYVIPSDFSISDCIILPGGFSYGDYLRCGAMAKVSHIMKAVTQFASKGGYVFGICNGFQILCEAGLLPGALLRNESQQFMCKNIYVRTVSTQSALTHDIDTSRPLKIPIAHAEGRYYADSSTIASLKANDQILFQYCDSEGHANELSNPNGSTLNIAGICNEERNVFGMMPHPERASESILGNMDGLQLFHSLLNNSERGNLVKNNLDTVMS